MKMPSFHVQAPTDTSHNRHGWSTEMLSAFKWHGKEEFANTSNRLPILYHPGTWRAAMGYAYDNASPGEFPYPLRLGTHASPITKQYGKEPYGTQHKIIRAPVTILYNGTLKYRNGPFSPNINDEFSYVDELLDAKQEKLVKHNAFTASVYDFGTPSFLACLFPTGQDSTPVVDDKSFLGGRLLYLCGFSINGAGNIYYDADPTFGTLSSTVISRDLDALRRSLKRFLNYKVVVYGRYGVNEVHVDLANNLFGQLKGAAQAFSDNVTIRGPFTSTDDLGANIQADVTEFLTSLK